MAPLGKCIKCSFFGFAQVQINNNFKNDTFTELPVSLVLFSLICIDVVERIRQCRLTGQGKHSTPNTSLYTIRECYQP